ncbi:MAG TPA: hypothetical protein VF581_02130 [Flavobacterium sp.]|jgi:cbb3-type cytochrome oxidase subunit 3
MYEFLQQIHAGWGILTLILLLIAVVNSLIGRSSKKEFLSKDRKITLFALIATHIQFLIGIAIYFNSPRGLAVLGEMKNDALRLTSMEHPLVNLIAITLITMGWSRHKKLAGSAAIFKNFLIFYGIGLLLILSRLPWDLLSEVFESSH